MKWKGWTKDSSNANDPGFRDNLMIYTQGLNNYFLDQKLRRNVLLIIGSGFVDIMTIVGFFRFVRYGTTWRLVLALSVFYLARAGI